MTFKDESSWKKCLSSKISTNNTKQKALKYLSGASPFPKRNISGQRSSAASVNLSFGDFVSPMSKSSEIRPFKIFVATWNVGGKAPHSELNLDDFRCVDDHQPDLYILGFQEIVPLNAGNVLVLEDSEPAAKWLLLIDQLLNSGISLDYANFFSSQASKESKSFGGSISFQKPSLRTIKKSFRAEVGRKLKTCNCQYDAEKKFIKDSCFRCKQANVIEEDSSSEEDELEASYVTENLASNSDSNQRPYSVVATKQMVGIFVTIWAKKEHVMHIGHVRLSCISRGIMGYLGNKGCISVSMSLYQTSFCFVCSHLASGEKEGDELRRNSDVVEIIKNTQFPRICQSVRHRFPYKILDHERVIWLGDLNYRIALSYFETKSLLEKNSWDALFDKDQLKIEREAGRVFRGWNEGKIFFRPTYKYSRNSDTYAGESVSSTKKRRTPAWCDRILWHGDGISQLSYIRGESRFSDHRPVCAVFMVDVDVPDERYKKGNVKIEVEELLPPNSSAVSSKLGSL